MTASDQLKAFVTSLATISGTTKFVLENGSVMGEFSPEHADFPRGAMGDCYMNAGREIHRRSDLRYVEGYAVPGTVPMPMMHAWLVDAEGRVIDPTWPDGVAYYGVIIPSDVLSECLMALGYWGVFDNLWMKPELLDLIKEGVTCQTTA